MNYFKKHFNYFYRKELPFFILYIILNIVVLFNFMLMNMFSKSFLSDNIIDINSLFLYLGLIISYYLLSFFMGLIDLKKLYITPVNNMMVQSFKRIMEKKYEDYNKKSRDDYLFYIFDLPDIVSPTLPSFFYILGALLQLIFVSVFLSGTFLYPLLIVIGIIPIFEIISNKYYRAFDKLWTVLTEKVMEFNKFVTKYLSGIWTVKIYSIEKYCLDKIKPKNSENSKFRAEWLYSHNVIKIISNIRTYFIQIVFILLIVIFNKGKALNFGVVINAIFFMSIFVGNVSQIVFSYSNIRRNKENIIKIIDNYDDNIEQESINIIGKNNITAISIKGLSYSYNRNGKLVNIFDNINLDINKRDKVIIIGENGSGKSTLLRILSNVSYIEEGEIKLHPLILDESSFNNTKLKSSFISASPYVFNITLKDNIKFDNEFSNDYIKEILDKVKLDEFYNSLPKKIDTVMDMKSFTISDGETTRIALCRSMVRENGIEIVFLDEFTKNFDSETEEIIIDELFKTFKNKTIITVSHRHSTVLKFDKIIFIDKDKKSILCIPKSELLNNKVVLDYINSMKGL